ncbi:DUF5004 domain-containing protein [Pedobacter polaris]|uniref:DUF5004 domain-containing protein n=1 Tax=Pedobacter polaris TaxID=2571273 RepID=A0A4U1CNH7_9SPHI|nr:DUF5004 domain-containing protein [Pedobacter polaris]TKC08253.1 DUF5004 domain-containing protein [Pedobacter polaris]
MKNIKYIILALCFLSFWGCKPEEFGPIGDPENVLKELQGTWTISKVTQKDEDAVTKGFPYKELDITNVYAYKELVIALQGDAAGNPTNFTITPGNSPKIADFNTGTWTVDDPNAPTIITLKNGTTSSILTLGSYAELKTGKFYLKKVKKFNGKAIVSYTYQFTKK